MQRCWRAVAGIAVLWAGVLGSASIAKAQAGGVETPGKLTVEQALEQSKQTGKPILAVAGTKT